MEHWIRTGWAAACLGWGLVFVVGVVRLRWLRWCWACDLECRDGTVKLDRIELFVGFVILGLVFVGGGRRAEWRYDLFLGFHRWWRLRRLAARLRPR